MRSSLRIAALVAAGALLAACAGQSAIYNNSISSAIDHTIMGMAPVGATSPPSYSATRSTSISRSSMRRLVAMLNESPTFLQPTHFTTTPGPSARLQYRAVLLFNRQLALPDQTCRNARGVPVAELGETMRLTMVFCRHGGLLSTVTGELEAVTGIDDPRFRRLIRQMVPLLFPPIDPTEDDNKSPFFITGGELRGWLG